VPRGLEIKIAEALARVRAQRPADWRPSCVERRLRPDRRHPV